MWPTEIFVVRLQRRRDQARSGVPLQIVFERHEDSDCSSKVIVSDSQPLRCDHRQDDGHVKACRWRGHPQGRRH